MLRGAEDLIKLYARSKHPRRARISFRPMSGTLSWEEVECLGACVNAPMMHDLQGQLTKTSRTTKLRAH
jgi:NADH-quinone oxidoreductase subunit E